MRGCLPSLLALASLCLSVQGARQQINPKDKATTSEEPKPWHRTVYGSVKEIVTPTVIGGVTFSAKPLATTDPLQPWVSLERNGRPKTIKPKLKNGRLENGSPTYSTYFQTVTTRTYSYEELKAHNMDPDGPPHEEEEFINEDDTYVSLNPIIRCTPDRYVNKGITKDVPSEPFCTPEEGQTLKQGDTFFATWYTNFFRDEDSDEVVENVRVHFSHVTESYHEKGLKKREVSSFFTSEWLKNVDGVYPFEIENEWLGDLRRRKIVISVQPENVPDEEFDPLDKGIAVYIDKGSAVTRKTKEQRALEDAGITGNKWWYVAITMPTVVIIALVLMYFFLYANHGYRDFSDITQKAMKKKHRVLGKVSEMKKFRNTKNHKYSELPSYKPGKQH
ncbi:hypothetical protein HG535_0C01020 [Zygotorulaspora mrakii]|uniref:Uncharacterized protein n=1 Tax=Zygotorulaspora mrakii TaxID=42260 RepID=A0A7H9AZU5_ZYGMR|nr:uncharacterized protein HG535_0C01020 [Zygotorulaspora mrakii]QLG71753.1 hypothetical protein HG535_0C01020 [Zygotorulaspora mrakii]